MNSVFLQKTAATASPKQRAKMILVSSFLSVCICLNVQLNTHETEKMSQSNAIQEWHFACGFIVKPSKEDQ